MHHLACIACLAVSIFSAVRPASADDGNASETPHWIWAPPDETGPVQFARTWTLDSTPVSATLQIAADYCDVAVELNGHVVLELESFAPTQVLDVTSFLVAGENQIALKAMPHVVTNPVGLRVPPSVPHAIALGITAMGTDGMNFELLTDESWAAEFNGVAGARSVAAMSLGRISPEMWGVRARSIEISPFDDYEQWRRATGDEAVDTGRYWVRDGFEIELVKSAAEDEGSWVALTFDDTGRLFVAREDRGLLRFTFDEPGGTVAHVEPIDNDRLLECRGLVYFGDILWACANNSRSIFRLSDADRDGTLERLELVREFSGGVGHGRNQLAVHDNALWMIGGDDVDIPVTDVFDRTSPFREARRGEVTREGSLLRMPGYGDELEVFSAGMRNPFGVAFNRNGEAFTYDADAEFDMGTPWYRPTRLLHMRSGADFGWRGVTGSWPPYDPNQPCFAQPLLDIGKGSPTAVDFGYDSNFPPAYREALYILDWAYGRVLAVHLTLRGASFRAQAETFLQGSPLNVTGIDFGPDGAMYLVTGGRNTQSALYRVRYVGEPIDEPVASEHDTQMAAYAEHAAAMHRLPELFNDGPDFEDVGFLLDSFLTLLSDRDPAIRYASQTALEHQAVELWDDLILMQDPDPSVLVGLMCLARTGQQKYAAPTLERLLNIDFAVLTVDLQLTQLHAVALCRKLDPSLETQHDALLSHFDHHFPADWPLRVTAYGTSINVERELARLLVELRAPGIVDRCIAELRQATTQEDQLHYLFLLRDVEEGWTEELHRTYFTALREADSFVAGEGMPGFLQRIRDSAIDRLTDAERAQLADLLEPAAAEEPPATIDRPLVREWTLDELLDAVGESDHEPSPERGALIFEQALCTRCHRVGARGPAVGPDLTFVGRRFSSEDILQSIVLPNQVVAENYRNVEVATLDGRIITGRPVSAGDYRSSIVRIAVDPLRPAEIVEINKQDIDVQQTSDTSPMPANLLNTFTVEEIIDLLAYVQGGGSG